MADEIATLHRKIEQHQQRIAVLQNALGKLPDTAQSAINVLVSELLTSMEELSVAEEELREQNETLYQTRQQLEIERQRYRDLFEYAPDAHVITDLNGVIRQASHAAVRMLNLDTKFLVGKPLAVFVVHDEQALFRSRLLGLQRGEAPEDFELQVTPRHAYQPISVFVTAALIQDETQRSANIHWSLRIISDRKRLEEQLRKLNAELESRVHERTVELERANQQKDELLTRERAARAEAERANEQRLKFLAMISHELRTPLTSIKGFASTLLADDIDWEPERWKTFVGIIDEESDKLTELVEHLLDLSRLQAGTLGITIRPTSVAEIMTQATRQLEVLVTDHILYIDAPDDLPPVQADPRRIAQVITNLVSNSVKFSPSQTDIDIKACHEHGAVQISVSDHGPGIPRSERERVFEVFIQLSNPDMKRQGAGLGLAICKGLIERHGGHIWIEERAEPGATIAFTLPVAQ